MKNPSVKPARLTEAIKNASDFEKRGEDILAQADEPEVEVTDRPSFSSVDPDETHEDLADATGAFAQSVDTITSGMLVILGQFDTSLKRAERLNRLALFMSVLMTLVAASSAWSVWKIQSILHSIAEADRRIDGMSRRLETAQAEQPRLVVVSDDSGGSRVVLRVPEILPTPSGSASSPPRAPATSVEFPLSTPIPTQKR